MSPSGGPGSFAAAPDHKTRLFFAYALPYNPFVPPTPYEEIREFLETKMRMSHIYQPVMLEVLLTQGGRASPREIAAAILAHDESQLDYYEQIVKRMPFPVLRAHGFVGREADSYVLMVNMSDLSGAERDDLIARCREVVESYKKRRGAAIWQHRAITSGLIPGRVRYDTLKRAAFRCELCGISADERALDVDHIVPKSQGGEDDPDNLQALCWLCNTNKGAGDDVDFRGIKASYSYREEGCLFCAPSQVVAENALVFLMFDGFPVTAGHLLAVPKRHVPDYFSLHQPERNAIQRLLDEGRRIVSGRHPDVSGFNVGINSGESAGQTIFHCHVHLIPRRVGDVENPRGGVRGVIPGKQNYVTAL